jgi:protein phosphatase methylesterase 1
MSDLYRSAISARIAKLPDLSHIEDDDDVNEDPADSIGVMPGRALGRPVMQVRI